MIANDESARQQREATIGHDEMPGREAGAVQRRRGKAWHHVVRHAGYHHDHEPEQQHVQVGRPVDHPGRMDRHRYTQGHTRSEPGKRRAEEAQDI